MTLLVAAGRDGERVHRARFGAVVLVVPVGDGLQRHGERRLGTQVLDQPALEEDLASVLEGLLVLAAGQHRRVLLFHLRERFMNVMSMSYPRSGPCQGGLGRGASPSRCAAVRLAAGHLRAAALGYRRPAATGLGQVQP
jgi:hypothetical protein